MGTAARGCSGWRTGQPGAAGLGASASRPGAEMLAAMSRRSTLSLVSWTLSGGAADAAGRLRAPESCFRTLDSFEWRGTVHPGVEACDVRQGRGPPLDPVKKRSVSVHFDLRYGPLVVTSSRRGRLLGENRSISEPITFTFGEIPPDVRKGPPTKQVVGVGMEVKYDAAAKVFYVQATPSRAPAARAGIQRGDSIESVDGVDANDFRLESLASRLQGNAGDSVQLTMRRGSQQYNTTLTREEYTVIKKRAQPTGDGGGGGLFAGKSEQEPPAALYVPQNLAGMQRGGLRTLRCPSELGYEGEGFGELPPDTTFLMDVELLEA